MSTDSLPPARRIGRFAAVYTHALYLTDAEGRTRGGLGFTDDGKPFVLLLDQAGTERVGLRIELDDTPAIVLSDGGGRPRAVLRMSADGTVGLRLTDHADRPRVVVGLEPDGRPCIGALGTQGDELWGWPIRPTAAAAVWSARGARRGRSPSCPGWRPS